MYDSLFRDDISTPTPFDERPALVGTGSRERVERSHSEGMIIQFLGKGSITSASRLPYIKYRFLLDGLLS